MARSSLLGIDPAPTEAPGRGADRLGPGDSSDSGSDMAGLQDDDADPGLPVDVAMRDDQAAPLPLGETLAAADDGDAGVRDGADIGLDRIFTPGQHEAEPGLAPGLLDEASLTASEEDEDEDEEDEAQGLDENGQALPRKTRKTRKTRMARKAGNAGAAPVDADANDDAEALPGEVDPAERRPGRD